VLAIAQTNIKRMLAYSTISHVGFLLLGILPGTLEGFAAAMFYALTYVLMVVGAFGMVLVLSRTGFEADNIEDFKGLNERSPWLALIMMLIMFSLAGIPFLVGFYAKLLVLQAIVNVGLVWLAVYAVIFSVIGAFYYLRIIKLMYFDPAEDNTPLNTSLDTQVVISVNGMLVLALGLYPSGLITLCTSVLLP
jgi:NADH-quinone oxidoreductase subunit N